MRILRFRITHDMGSLEVSLGLDQQRWYDKLKTDAERREFVAHEAWRQLFESDAKVMLRKLCDKIGVDKVKKAFHDAIRIEEI